VDLTQRYSSCYCATVGEPARLPQEVGACRQDTNPAVGLGPFGNFLELRHGEEVRRICLLGTWVNKSSRSKCRGLE